MFNQAAPDIINPCRGVPKFRERSRDRWLTPDELKRFFAALDDPRTPTDLRDYAIMSLFTGARRSNVLSMKWTDVDLTLQTWTIPADESKNSEAMAIPLVAQAMEILERRRKTASSIYVFPSETSKTGHYVTPTKAWSSLLKRADLQGVRLHDLRRTLGSHMAADGTSLHLIGKALGHKHTSTTQVYARVDLDPVRSAMERAAATMESARELPEKVVSVGGA
jgi:integrase